MMRLEPHVLVAVSLVAGGCAPGDPGGTTEPPLSVVEATIPEMQAAMAEGRITARELVELHLARVERYEERLNAAITINENALAEADSLDAERASGRVRGPLHGIPIALKDNIQTTHIPTTYGALAFRDYTPPYEATLTTRLREAGAIIIAKAGLTEFANWMAGAPNPMPGNYTAIAGYGYNPYDPRPDPREGRDDGRPALSTGGSSSGIGTAASFWAANIGTDTGGSIISPSNANMLVGIRPTLARVSRWGIAPVTLDHDMAGPMARTVTDAAIVLGVIESAEPDPRDPATGVCEAPPGGDYTPFLDPDGLRGARIGVPRVWYYEELTLTGADDPVGGLTDEQSALMAEAMEILVESGATLVDPADVPSFVATDPDDNFHAWPLCIGGHQDRAGDAGCTVNFKYGAKRDFNAWLATLGETAPVRTLTELREWNIAHAGEGAMKYGQSRFDISDEMDLERDRARNEADMAKDARLSRDEGIDAVLERYELDAILTPGSTGAGLAARAQYPHIVVPFGFAANDPTPPFPEGFDARPGPFGVGFTASACSEPRLIEIAYAFEQASRRRVPPPDLP
ncbi:MAG: amidase family protein [Gemmatimonadota bacterium]|nr:amidase family protein [Gemmatimonadota bacterium]